MAISAFDLSSRSPNGRIRKLPMFLTTRVETKQPSSIFAKKRNFVYFRNISCSQKFSFQRKQKNLLVFAETEIFRGFSRKIFNIFSMTYNLFKLHVIAFTYFYNKTFNKIFATIRTKNVGFFRTFSQAPFAKIVVSTLLTVPPHKVNKGLTSVV